MFHRHKASKFFIWYYVAARFRVQTESKEISLSHAVSGLLHMLRELNKYESMRCLGISLSSICVADILGKDDPVMTSRLNTLKETPLPVRL